MKRKWKFISPLVVILMITAAANCQPGKKDAILRVYIIRHGEKSNTIDSLSCDSSGVVGDNLSCRGLNRALALTEVLHKKIGIPGHVYVPAPHLGKSTGSSRMFQTVTPFAVKYNLAINTNYEQTETKDAAASILKHTGTVLVVWEHNNIPSLVKHLGVTSSIPKWPCADFDSIWEVEISNGKAKLSMKDREGISPSSSCPN